MYTYPGQAFDRTLIALKGWYKESALDAAVAISSNVNISSTHAAVAPGLVVHATSITAAIQPYGTASDGPGTFVVELGCLGNAQGMPMYLWSNPQDPDVSNPGIDAAYSAYGATGHLPSHVSVLPMVSGQNLVALVASGGYEVESTEFDTAQTYTTGQGLRAVTSNTNANGGKVTNQGATSNAFTSSTTLLWGDPTATAWDTIVGIVSRGAYTNANMKSVLGFWTCYYPGTR